MSINQNDQILDDVRQRLALPVIGELSLPVGERIVPVLVVDAATAPTMQQFGDAFFTVAANPGFRSEAAVSSATAGLFNVPGWLVEVYVWIYAVAGVAYQVVIPSAGLATFTQTASPLNDFRYPSQNNGPVFVGAKNTAAATAGVTQGNLTNNATGTIGPLGPYYLDPTRAGSREILVRPAADNVLIFGAWKYRVLRKRS